MLSQPMLEDFSSSDIRRVYAQKDARPQYFCGSCHVIVSKFDDACPHCHALFVNGGEIWQ
jgi:hypothetical protein